jgi:choline dehydrogenase-like flavoprotein
MIADFPDIAVEPYDLCIVGAGPAGITLALELADSGLRICLLEAGGESYHRETQRLFEGEVSGDRYPPLRDTRLGALGGSSGVWAGWCRPLEAADFEPCAGAGAGWPFKLEELSAYYRRAHVRCGLGEFEYDAARWQDYLQHAPLLNDDAMIEHAMFHVLPLRFGEHYRARLESSEGIHVVLGAPVANLRMSVGGTGGCCCHRNKKWGRAQRQGATIRACRWRHRKRSTASRLGRVAGACPRQCARLGRQILH